MTRIDQKSLKKRLEMTNLTPIVGKLVDAADAQSIEVFTRAVHVSISIVVGDVRHAYDNTFGHAIVVQEPLQIIEHALIVVACVAAVNTGVHILDVDDVLMHMRQETFKMMAIHVEGGFHRDVPLGRCHAAKGVDKIAADGWLTATKGDATASGQKIQVVDHHLVEQFDRRDSS